MQAGDRCCCAPMACGAASPTPSSPSNWPAARSSECGARAGRAGPAQRRSQERQRHRAGGGVGGRRGQPDSSPAVSTESLGDEVFASTIQASLASGAAPDELDDAEIERSIREINEAIQRSSKKRPDPAAGRRRPAAGFRPRATLPYAIPENPMTTSCDLPAGRACDALRPVTHPARIHPPCRRLGAGELRQTHGAVHRFGRRKGAAAQAGQRRRLGHGRVRHAAARHPHPRRPRGRARQAERAHAGDPAPDRPLAARVFDLARSGRAQHPAGLRRAAGRRRHPHGGDHRRLRRRARCGELAAGRRGAWRPARSATMSPRCRWACAGHAAAGPGVHRRLGLRHRHERGDDRRSGGFVEVQGTAEGAPFSRAEMLALLALAERGIRSWWPRRRRHWLLDGEGAMRLVLASTTPRSSQSCARCSRAAAAAGGRRASSASPRPTSRTITFIENALAKARHARSGLRRCGHRRRFRSVRRRAGRCAGCGVGALCAEPLPGRGPRGPPPPCRTRPTTNAAAAAPAGHGRPPRALRQHPGGGAPRRRSRAAGGRRPLAR
jgi:hypothetical protein